MKRIIRFRGKDVLTGEWVYGYYTTAKTRDPETGEKTIKHIIHADDGLHEVDENTVGQYTGLNDCVGVEIYEGDILRIEVSDGYAIYKLVKFHQDRAAFCIANNYDLQFEGKWEIWDRVTHQWLDEMKAVVVGNIHDNPELLKGGEE